MAFPPQTTRPFTRLGVEVLNPNQNGVYGIFRHDAWIYVGRGDVRSRMMTHLNNPDIMRHGPTHFVAEVTGNDVLREKQLIIELRPIANQKLG